MCYNISLTEKNIARYAKFYNMELPAGGMPGNLGEDFLPYYFVSGFTHPLLPVVGSKEVLLARWGLIPYWVKNLENAMALRSKTLNASGETLFEKPSFKNPIKNGRVILGVSGFFEWRDVNGIKYPYFVHQSNGEYLSLGCVSDRWIDPESGSSLQTFSIVTTMANSLMEKIHNSRKRMPLILSSENAKTWIDPALDKQQVERLIAPYAGNDIDAYPVSRQFNNSRINRNIPAVLERVRYDELDIS